MDGSSTLDCFLEEIDAAAEVMRQQAAKQLRASPACAQWNGNNAPVEDLLTLLDQLIELLEFKEVMLAEQPNVWTSPQNARDDPRLLGSQLDRLRARRRFWESLRHHDPGLPSVDCDTPKR